MIAKTQYCNNNTTPQSALLAMVEAYTIANHPKAHMVSGAYQGRLLSMLSCLAKPNNILEIGTFTGFSALCLAEGLTQNGVLHTIENRTTEASIAQDFFNKSIYGAQIILHVANAIEIIPTLHVAWDLVFLDADKTAYINYYEIVLPKLKVGGLIIADNVLFHDEVLQEKLIGKNAIAIDAFNNHIVNDKRVAIIMLPIRDGITLIRKL